METDLENPEIKVEKHVKNNNDLNKIYKLLKHFKYMNNVKQNTNIFIIVLLVWIFVITLLILINKI